MKKFINFRPILFIALSLCCGISATYFYMRNILIWGIFFTLLFCCLLSIYYIFFTTKETRKRNTIFSIIFVFLFVAGGLGLYTNLTRFSNANLDGHNYDITAKIIDIKENSSGCNAILDNVKIVGNRKGELYYKISLNIYGETNIDVGDIIKFNANLQDNDYIYEDVFYASAIENGIKYKANVNAEYIEKIGENLTIFEKVNIFIRNSLAKGLDKEEFAVGYALLTGNSNFIDNELISSYRNAGVAHIFAVSGLHIGFLATILIFIFKKINLNRYLRILIMTIVLLFYSGVCGFSASSLRATTMILISSFAFAWGKRYDALTSLSLSAIIILLISPVQLFCVGFQLSFMVVLGIIVLTKPIANTLKFLPQKFSTAIGVVLSAQIFSIPICLYAFGQVSLISVIVNILFTPLVSFIYTLTLIATIVGGIFSISYITLFPSNYILKLVNLCINAFDYKIFLVGGITLGGGAISYYLTAFIVGGMFNLKKKLKSISAIIMASICLLSVVFVNIDNYNSAKIYVSSNDSISATFISCQDTNTLIVSDVNHVFSMSALTRVSEKSGQTRLDNLIFMDGYNVDMQVCITKILSVFTIQNVYYFGDKQDNMELICKASFPEIKFKNYYENETLKINEFRLKVGAVGKVLIGDIKGRKTAIFSKLGENGWGFKDIDKNIDIMICLDGASSLFSRYSPKTPISYKYSSVYQNAQSNGNIFIKID